MQSPSSLIFVLLLGVWAAYFVNYLVRRRDHLSTARSVDQFSSAMRVLDRRDSAAPSTPVAAEPAGPRAYAVHPARSARSAGSPVVTERVASGVTSRPVRSVRPQISPSRRVRGITLLAVAAALLISLPLALFSVLAAWAPLVPLAALGASVAWVRSGVRAQASLTRAHRRRQAELARLRTTAPVTVPAASRGAPATRPAPTATTATAADVATGATASAPVEPAVPAVVASVEAPAVEPAAVVAPVAAAPLATQPAAEVMVPILDEDDMPLTWDPVPVPRPTYTMKAMAPRAEVEPAEVTPTPAPVERQSESESPVYDGRRAAGA